MLLEGPILAKVIVRQIFGWITSSAVVTNRPSLLVDTGDGISTIVFILRMQELFATTALFQRLKVRPGIKGNTVDKGTHCFTYTGAEE